MNEDTPQTLPENGAAPKTRVGSVTSVLQRISELREDDKTRASRRASQKGILNGERPFSTSKLESQGKKNATNFNLREAEGQKDAAQSPYYGLVFRTPRFANVRCRYGQNGQQNAEWSEKVSNRFHEMLSGWQEHDFNVQLMQGQMVYYGVGTIMHDEELPFWEAVNINEMLVPDGTKANIDRLEECTVGPRKMSPVELWKKAEQNSEWKKENIRKAIIAAAPVSLRRDYGDQWSEQYQDSLRNGDVMWSGKNSQIGIYHYLVKEFSGKITHVIVVADGMGEEALLYQKNERYESFRQILLPFFHDIGTGEWHSVKGLGPKIHDFCHESNKLSCKMYDAAKRSLGLIFQAGDANAARKTQIVEISDGIVVPSDLTISERKFQPSLQEAIAVKRDMQGTLQSNTGSYRQRLAGENYEPTLGQAQLNFHQQGQLSDSATDRYMVTLDQLYREQVRKAMVLGKKLSTFNSAEPAPVQPKRNNDPLKELVRAFFDGCLEDGVPKEALKFENVVSVKATRGMGNGSPISMQLASDGLMGLLPMMDERGRRNALRTKTSTLVGQGNVDMYFPPFDENQLPDDHTALAVLENNALRTKDGQVAITPQQDHLTHAQVHLSDAMQHAQGVQQGQANPMEVLLHLHNAGPHIKTHLDGMVNDPTRKEPLEALTKSWLMLGKVADQLTQQITEAAQAAAKEQANQPPPVDPALVTGMAKVQGDLEIKRAKAAGDLMLKADKQKATQQLKGIETADELMRKRAVTMAEIMTPRNGQ